MQYIVSLMIYIIIGTLVLLVPVLLVRAITLWIDGHKFYPALKYLVSSPRQWFFTFLASLAVLIILFGLLIFVYVPMNRFRQEQSKVNPDILGQLVRGKIGYNIPDTMEVDKRYWGTVVITKALNDSILFSHEESRYFETAEITVSSRVRVALLDPTGGGNFRIIPLNTEEQLVDTISNTIWRWNIVPLTSGENELKLRATVKIYDAFEGSYRDIMVFDKTIVVQSSFYVGASKFISNNWQWLVSVILIPFVIWAYKEIRSKRKKRSPAGFVINNEKKKD